VTVVRTDDEETAVMSGQEHGVAGGNAVTFVNRFTLQAPPDEFERLFAETARFMAEQPGFIGFSLMRHLERADQYVNIAHWTDVESFRRAVSQPEFRPHAEALRAISRSESDLYLPRQIVGAAAR
jgi:heme-degrading monooxygenase HmoA